MRTHGTHELDALSESETTLFLALDLGTSFIKGATLDLDARALRKIRRVPFPSPLPRQPRGRVEFDPGVIVSEVAKLLESLIEPGTQYEGLVMCCQMSCLVLTDSAGKAYTNCIGWRDQRALEQYPGKPGTYYEALQQRLTPQQCQELGNELSPGSPIAFLFWMREHGLLFPGMMPVSLGDFVLSALMSIRPTVDGTNAMAYNLLRLNPLTWHNEVIANLRLDELDWPTLRQNADIIGYLPGNQLIPCYPAVGDYQCALAGALLSERELSLNVSTGSQVSRLTKRLEPGGYQTRPFFDGNFANLYSHLPAGRALNVLMDLLSELARAEGAPLDRFWPYVNQATVEAPETNLEVDLSFYPGPAGQDGAIRNIQESNLTVGTLFRAAFTNMAQTYRSMAERIWPEQGWERLVFSGGLVQKSEALQQSIVRQFGCSYRFSPSAEDTLIGLLVLARVFSGRAGSVLQEMQALRDFYDVVPLGNSET